MSLKSKGQAWIGAVVTSVIGLVISAQILFTQIGPMKQQYGVINSTGSYVNGSLSTSEFALANLTPTVLIAGFLIMAVGLFLYSKK